MMAARKNWPTELKTEIVLSVLRGEATAAELARRHGINEGTISRWRLNSRAADNEKTQLKSENERLKK
jgi:transposase-like protein